MLVVLAVIAGFTWLQGCTYFIGSWNPRPLRALRHDPMATYAPPAPARSLGRDEENAGSGMGMPRYAKLDRSFDLPAGAGSGALRDAVMAARRAGWPIELPPENAPSLGGVLGTAQAQRSFGRDRNAGASISIRLTEPAPGMPGPAPGHERLEIELTSGDH